MEINAITEPTGIGAAQLQYKEINQANDWFDKLERSFIKVWFIWNMEILLKDWDMPTIRREGTNDNENRK